MKCDKCGQELKEKETMEIEGMIITKPEICKTYQEAKDNCPKGFRLPTRWELFKLLEKMENRKRLSDRRYTFFWSSLVEDDYIKGLFLNRGLDVDSDVERLADSSEGGRVIYVKESEK